MCLFYVFSLFPPCTPFSRFVITVIRIYIEITITCIEITITYIIGTKFNVSIDVSKEP